MLKIQLIYNYAETNDGQNCAIKKGVELLKADKKELQEEWRKRRDELLKEKINVTAFLTWFIENYPDSKTIMKENPNYQSNFK